MGGVSVLVPPCSFGFELEREGGGGRGREREGEGGTNTFLIKNIDKTTNTSPSFVTLAPFFTLSIPCLASPASRPSPPFPSLVTSFSHRLDPLPLDKLTARRAACKRSVSLPFVAAHRAAAALFVTNFFWRRQAW